MECEDEYQERVLELSAKAKAVEEKWSDESDENKKSCAVKPSMGISDGGYRTMGWTPSHPDYRYAGPCVRCNGSNVSRYHVVAGCRRNGDGYGSDFMICNVCGFLCWTSYDEA